MWFPYWSWLKRFNPWNAGKRMQGESCSKTVVVIRSKRRKLVQKHTSQHSCKPLKNQSE